MEKGDPPEVIQRPKIGAKFGAVAESMLVEAELVFAGDYGIYRALNRNTKT